MACALRPAGSGLEADARGDQGMAQRARHRRGERDDQIVNFCSISCRVHWQFRVMRAISRMTASVRAL